MAGTRWWSLLLPVALSCAPAAEGPDSPHFGLATEEPTQPAASSATSTTFEPVPEQATELLFGDAFLRHGPVHCRSSQYEVTFDDARYQFNDCKLTVMPTEQV